MASRQITEKPQVKRKPTFEAVTPQQTPKKLRGTTADTKNIETAHEDEIAQQPIEAPAAIIMQPSEVKVEMKDDASGSEPERQDDEVAADQGAAYGGTVPIKQDEVMQFTKSECGAQPGGELQQEEEARQEEEAGPDDEEKRTQHEEVAQAHREMVEEAQNY